MEVRAVECIRERLGPERRDEPMGVPIACLEVDAAEAARVDVPEHATVVEDEVDVRVRSRRRAVRDDTKAAGHAEMNEDRTVVYDQSEIFCASRDVRDPRTSQTFRQANWPTQSLVANDPAGNPASDQVRLDAAPGGFDFGKLRHETGARAGLT
jgi:hypothetical protein